MSDAWSRIALLAEDEVALARAGRWEELPAAMEARVAAAALLGQAPPAAAGALDRAAAAHRELIALLEAGRAQTRAELARLREGAVAVRGYAPSADAGRVLAAG